MPIGVIINCLAVTIGGLCGNVVGQKLSDYMIEQLYMVLGLCSLGMGISSIVLMKNMSAVIFALVIGTGIGLLFQVGKWIDRGAGLLEKGMTKMGVQNRSLLSQNEYRATLITTIVLFCASGTGIYGCLDAGMSGDSSILISKSILDLFTAAIIACQIGLVTAMVALPQFLIFSLLLLCAKFIFPLTTITMIADFKACGGFLMLATGLRILKMKEFPIADMLPAMVLVFPFSHLWEMVILPILM